MDFFQAVKPQQLILLGVATVAGVLLLLRAIRMRREAAADPLKAFQRGGLPSRNQQPPDELIRWEVQMHDTARELKAELNSKMVALQVLIRQADEQCQRLEQLLGETRKAEVGTRNVEVQVRNAERGMRSGE